VQNFEQCMPSNNGMPALCRNVSFISQIRAIQAKETLRNEMKAGTLPDAVKPGLHSSLLFHFAITLGDPFQDSHWKVFKER
jgi:hypothetical protein